MKQINGITLPDDTIKAVPGVNAGVWYQTSDGRYWFACDAHRRGLLVSQRSYDNPDFKQADKEVIYDR